MTKQFRGMDVSKWQGEIDFQRAKQDGIQFVMLRTGFGRFETQKDSCFETNYKNAKANGLAVGAYHYSYAKTPEEAKQEARLCLQMLKGKTLEFPLCFDMEERSVAQLGKTQVSAIAKAFCTAAEAAGYYVCIYANKHWLTAYFTPEILKKYDIWLAEWKNAPTYTGSYGLWQYSSDGCVDGVNGRVDMDYAYKNYPKIIKAKGLNGFAPSAARPTPEPPHRPAAKPTPRPSAHRAGDAVRLQNALLFPTAVSHRAAARKSGVYFLYDGELKNGRYRITNRKDRVRKKPAGLYVTGYVRASDLR